MKIYSVVCVPEGENPYTCCCFTSLQAAKDFVFGVCNKPKVEVSEGGLIVSYSIFKYFITSCVLHNFEV